MTLEKRIALYIPNLEGGGAERIMIQLARGFSDLGLRVDLVLVKACGKYLTEVPPDVHIVDLQARNAYQSAPGLLRYMIRDKPDVMISALDLTNLIALLSSRILRAATRMVIQIVGTATLRKRSPWKKNLEKLLLSQIYPSAHEIVAVSKGVAQDLSEYTGIPLERIRVIYNPVITPDLYEKAGLPVNHPWFSSPQPPVILGVGRLTEVKDFATLLHAFARVRQTHPARLVILGEGEQRPYLQHLADTLGIASDFDMPGFTANPFAYMHKASAFVLSSITEALPNALIEAMACGCPVISTDCHSGPTEILDGGKYGHLIPVGDIDSMAEAILSTLRGDTRFPPADWLTQFQLNPVIRQYLEVMGLQEVKLSSPG